MASSTIANWLKNIMAKSGIHVDTDLQDPLGTKCLSVHSGKCRGDYGRDPESGRLEQSISVPEILLQTTTPLLGELSFQSCQPVPNKLQNHIDMRH